VWREFYLRPKALVRHPRKFGWVGWPPPTPIMEPLLVLTILLCKEIHHATEKLQTPDYKSDIWHREKMFFFTGQSIAIEDNVWYVNEI
jgi:hypothetical protein